MSRLLYEDEDDDDVFLPNDTSQGPFSSGPGGVLDDGVVPELMSPNPPHSNNSNTRKKSPRQRLFAASDDRGPVNKEVLNSPGTTRLRCHEDCAELDGSSLIDAGERRTSEYTYSVSIERTPAKPRIKSAASAGHTRRLGSIEHTPDKEPIERVGNRTPLKQRRGSSSTDSCYFGSVGSSGDKKHEGSTPSKQRRGSQNSGGNSGVGSTLLDILTTPPVNSRCRTSSVSSGYDEITGYNMRIQYTPTSDSPDAGSADWTFTNLDQFATPTKAIRTPRKTPRKSATPYTIPTGVPQEFGGDSPKSRKLSSGESTAYLELDHMCCVRESACSAVVPDLSAIDWGDPGQLLSNIEEGQCDAVVPKHEESSQESNKLTFSQDIIDFEGYLHFYKLVLANIEEEHSDTDTKSPYLSQAICRVWKSLPSNEQTLFNTAAMKERPNDNYSLDLFDDDLAPPAADDSQRHLAEELKQPIAACFDVPIVTSSLSELSLVAIDSIANDVLDTYKTLFKSTNPGSDEGLASTLQSSPLDEDSMDILLDDIQPSIDSLVIDVDSIYQSQEKETPIRLLLTNSSDASQSSNDTSDGDWLCVRHKKPLVQDAMVSDSLVPPSCTVSQDSCIGLQDSPDDPEGQVVPDIGTPPRCSLGDIHLDEFDRDVFSDRLKLWKPSQESDTDSGRNSDTLQCDELVSE